MENQQAEQADRYVNSIVYDAQQNISEEQQEQIVNILHNEQSTVNDSLTLNNEINNKETLKQQLDRINQKNIERYLKLKESRQEFKTVNNNMIDKNLDYCDIEWFALEMNRDHFVVFEIASKYCISDSFVDHDGYSISFEDSCPQ